MFHTSLCVWRRRRRRRPHFTTVRKLHGKYMATFGSNEAVMLVAAGNYADLSDFTSKRGVLGGLHICIYMYVYVHIHLYIYT